MLRFVQRPGDRSWFERPAGISGVLHRLLMQRGIRSGEEAQAFLHPSSSQLEDPFLLSDMTAAVERIRRAIDSCEKICIYGDYDVDGVCASAILYDYFRSISIGAEVYLPSRHSEGYGLNEAAVRELAERCDLLITVDCGISSRDLIGLATELGMDCIVTDHHRPGELLPQCPVVNPLLNDYPFPCLCGAGVAFKLVHALAGIDAAMERIDLAAIATVADVVSLSGENRAIVHLGLKMMNAKPRPGVEALMEAARIEAGKLDSQGIAFRLAPRLNAGGRLGSARRSFELLIQEEPFLAIAQADELEQENARRQSVEREIRAEAEAQLKDFDFSAHRIIMVRGTGWNPGVIGLAASHLKEKYHFPVIALAENDGVLTGSCRSIEGVDIYETLASAAPLMEKFGGHRQAAGLTVKAENFDALQAALDEYLFANIPPETYLPFADYDIQVNLGECSESFVQELAALEPTGCGNPEPVFRASVNLLEARAIGSQGSHLRLIAAEDGTRRTGIYFGAGHMAGRLGDSAEILFTPQLNHWNGRTDVQLRLEALRETAPLRRIEAARAEGDSLQRRFLTELLYNRRKLCSRQLPGLSLRELKDILAVEPQGTWIICADYAVAEVLLRGLNPCPLDLSIGELPQDSRAFNSLVCCPGSTAAFPKALRRLVFAGVPAPEELPPDAQCFCLEASWALWRELPDIAQMREVYKACLHISRRPVHMPDWDALDAQLAEETGLSPICCRASMLALLDMGLVSLYDRPFALRMPPMKKTDPESSALWRSLQAIKTNAEGVCSNAE